MLADSDRPLVDTHDLLVLDLDGVVYRGPAAVPGAAAALTQARARGLKVAFVTNNAARPPDVVAAHLVDLGVETAPGDVVTSAQAAARLAAAVVPPDSAVYVIGGAGLLTALRERGLRPITDVAALPSEGPAAVVQGYGPDVPWRQVVDGAILVQQGCPWVVSNTDMTIPTDRGLGPGNGTLVRLLAQYADREPVVAGKPEPALFEETLDRVGGTSPLMVGDRLDTDIAGAVRLGWDSLLVLTGVTGLAELVTAGPAVRPTFLGSDLSALGQSHAAPRVSDDEVVLDGWRVRLDRDRLRVEGSGSVDAWWRAVAVAAWRHLDVAGTPADTTGLVPPTAADSGAGGDR